MDSFIIGKAYLIISIVINFKTFFILLKGLTKNALTTAVFFFFLGKLKKARREMSTIPILESKLIIIKAHCIRLGHRIRIKKDQMESN